MPLAPGLEDMTGQGQGVHFGGKLKLTAFGTTRKCYIITNVQEQGLGMRPCKQEGWRAMSLALPFVLLLLPLLFLK